MYPQRIQDINIKAKNSTKTGRILSRGIDNTCKYIKCNKIQTSGAYTNLTTATVSSKSKLADTLPLTYK
jgi:hypothetical protein